MTVTRKVARVGIVGGIVGGIVYLLATASRRDARPSWGTMAPEPVERDPNVLPQPPSRGGH